MRVLASDNVDDFDAFLHGILFVNRLKCIYRFLKHDCAIRIACFQRVPIRKVASGFQHFIGTVIGQNLLLLAKQFAVNFNTSFAF